MFWMFIISQTPFDSQVSYISPQYCPLNQLFTEKSYIAILNVISTVLTLYQHRASRGLNKHLPSILPLKTFKLTLLQTCRRHRLAEEANELRSVVYTSSHYFKVRFVSVQYPTRMVSVNLVAFPSEIPVISLI